MTARNNESNYRPPVWSNDSESTHIEIAFTWTMEIDATEIDGIE